MSFCIACGKVLERKLACSVCKSRAYCGAICQKADWKNGHKEQCKTLATARQKLKEEGAKVRTGVHPELVRRDNVLTGETANRMRRPKSYEHQEANIRRTMSQILREFNPSCSGYTAMAYDLAECFHEQVPWSEFQAELRSVQEMGISETEARMVLEYREGAYVVGKSELLSLGPTPLNAKLLPKDCNTITVFVPRGVKKEGESKNDLSDKALEAVAARCTRLVDVRLQFQTQFRATTMLKLVQSNSQLSNLDLTGCADAVDDAVLSALSTNCPLLRFLAFGCDNLNLEPLAVTSDKLAALATNCRSLRILRVLHRTLSGDPSDPDGAVAKSLLSTGLKLRRCVDAEEFRSGLKEDGTLFWRDAIEFGTLSACWFERV